MSELYTLQVTMPIINNCELTQWLLDHSEIYQSWPIMCTSLKYVRVTFTEEHMTPRMLKYGIGNVKKKESAISAE